MSLFFNGELENSRCDAFLPVGESERVGIFEKVCFLYTNFVKKTFPVSCGTS
jgi:hypothetical protein